jgi:hypothetical protein
LKLSIRGGFDKRHEGKRLARQDLRAGEELALDFEGLATTTIAARWSPVAAVAGFNEGSY